MRDKESTAFDEVVRKKKKIIKNNNRTDLFKEAIKIYIFNIYI